MWLSADQEAHRMQRMALALASVVPATYCNEYSRGAVPSDVLFAVYGLATRLPLTQSLGYRLLAVWVSGTPSPVVSSMLTTPSPVVSYPMALGTPSPVVSVGMPMGDPSGNGARYLWQRKKKENREGPPRGKMELRWRWTMQQGVIHHAAA